MLSNTIFNAERPERVKDSKRGKRWRRWKHGRQKDLRKPVPRAAAAYGRQLKTELPQEFTIIDKKSLFSH